MRHALIGAMAQTRLSPKTFVAAAALSLFAGFAAPVSAADSREIQGYEVRVPNVSLSAGAARARVASTHETLRSVVTDYAHYSQIITRFEKARIVGKVGQQTDVYLEVPILHGATKVWAV